MRLSEVLKNYREENDLSQREFARMCGLSNSLISILEMGVNPQTGKAMDPDLRTYRRLADGMGITVDDLFTRIKEDVHQGSAGMSSFDHAVIEALHQNPKLRMLFDLQKDMSDSNLNVVLGVVNAIAKERGDDD